MLHGRTYPFTFISFINVVVLSPLEFKIYQDVHAFTKRQRFTHKADNISNNSFPSSENLVSKTTSHENISSSTQHKLGSGTKALQPPPRSSPPKERRRMTRPGQKSSPLHTKKKEFANRKTSSSPAIDQEWTPIPRDPRLSREFFSKEALELLDKFEEEGGEADEIDPTPTPIRRAPTRIPTPVGCAPSTEDCAPSPTTESVLGIWSALITPNKPGESISGINLKLFKDSTNKADTSHPSDANAGIFSMDYWREHDYLSFRDSTKTKSTNGECKISEKSKKSKEETLTSFVVEETDRDEISIFGRFTRVATKINFDIINTTERLSVWAELVDDDSAFQLAEGVEGEGGLRSGDFGNLADEKRMAGVIGFDETDRDEEVSLMEKSGISSKPNLQITVPMQRHSQFGIHALMERAVNPLDFDSAAAVCQRIVFTQSLETASDLERKRAEEVKVL